MAKLIVVCGSTGQVGGSIARRMLKEGWRVRGITRNVNGDAAKALSEQGAEMTTADYDDEASLTKAFEGAHAIFGLTQFWEYLMTLGQHGAGQKEYEQILTIARVASQTETLEHFILHTLASGEKLAGPEFACPHWDYKDKAADEIKKSMPKLAAKTTFLWIGWFTSNLWGLIRPMEVPGTYGGHIWLVPGKPSLLMYITDIENNVGIFVKYILAKPDISRGAKYVSVHTDIVPYGDALKTWCEVTGKRAEFIEISDAASEGLMGVFGKELASQFRMNEVAEGDWGKPYGKDVVTSAELGIPASELLNMKQSLEANKEKL
ncbi:hypothetical protein LTR56_014912 [Elasticomyces elasticus]|nr:hypothetical protein LTR56_014912 [Elasticomyces elasticus]KAK3653275.1 hypothetical protein LTR22_011235 [Elasticomyces elasticus]KAK4918280.1 hypothetical protein LTR49_013979 [Elasticomyces elasticus]KAK5758334.1 hypothetical protein LTS12_011507 [Elasticomyces elasticus]